MYGPSTLAADWNRPPWTDGPDEGYLSVVEGPEGYEGGRSMKIRYPGGGEVWNTPFGAGGALQSHEELYVAYRVKVQSGFDFVKEGKNARPGWGARNDDGSLRR